MTNKTFILHDDFTWEEAAGQTKEGPLPLIDAAAFASEYMVDHGDPATFWKNLHSVARFIARIEADYDGISVPGYVSGMIRDALAVALKRPLLLPDAQFELAERLLRGTLGPTSRVNAASCSPDSADKRPTSDRDKAPRSRP